MRLLKTAGIVIIAGCGLSGCDTLKTYPMINPQTSQRVVCSTGLNQPIIPVVEKQFKDCIVTCERSGHPISRINELMPWQRWSFDDNNPADRR
jgi:hypothetical protein